MCAGEELGAKFDEVEIPDDLKEKAQEYREKLIDMIVELDDDVLTAYFDVRAALACPSHSGCFLNRAALQARASTVAAALRRGFSRGGKRAPAEGGQLSQTRAAWHCEAQPNSDVGVSQDDD